MNACATERDYWNEVMSNVHKNGKVLDNIWKRQEQVKMLLDYDFYQRHVLEIGIGNGSLAASLLSSTGAQAFYRGMDISDKAVQEVRNRLGLKAVQADARNIPFEDKRFDYIIAFDVLEHIPTDDRTQVYRQMDRVLKDQGVIFLHFSLMESAHDKNFDFKYDLHDLVELTDIVGGTLTKVKTYTIDIWGKPNTYQFISIERTNS